MKIDLTSLLNLQRIDIDTAIQRGLDANERPIILLNDEQLDSGIDANNKSLGRYKNLSYKGRFSPIDLKLKGEFRNAENLKIVHDGSSFSMEDSDFKTPFLVKRFGGAILGLTDKNIAIAAEIIYPDVIKVLEEQIS